MPRDLVSDEKYPPYFSGAAYLVSQNVAQVLHKNVDKVPMIPLDDTFIGYLLQYSNLKWM